jgi:8-oxo-dGTP diphosphatase
VSDVSFLDRLCVEAERDGVQQLVVGAVVQHDGAVLLLQRPVHEFMGGIFELPSGKVEPGESLDAALVREVLEETGLEVSTIGTYLGHFDYLSGSGKKSRQFNFAVEVSAATAVVLHEHDAYAWTPIDVDPPVTDAVRAVLATFLDDHRAHGGLRSEDSSTCYCCGKVLGPDNLAWDYPLPDDLAKLTEDELARCMTVNTGQIVVAKGFGNAIRVILPVPLDTGRTATFGVWLAIATADEWHRVVDAAGGRGEPWPGCTFSGRLLNAVAPWPEVYLANATARAPGENKVAWIVASPHEKLSQVLIGPWSQHEVVAAQSR